jgi:hypothetical protein
MDNEQRELINNSIFVVCLIETGNAEEFSVGRSYFVGTNLNAAIYAQVLVEKASGGKAMIEVWKDNSPNPEGLMSAMSAQGCENCEYKTECDKSNEEGSPIKNCKKKEIEFGLSKPDAVNKECVSNNRPDGLTKDVDSADLLIEAFKAMNKKE